MKITMLGTSRAGKTTYLSALLGTLYEGAIDGFRIGPFDSTNEEINKELDKINVLYKEGKWPDGTSGDNVRNLSLSLFKNQNRLVDFDFIDYRGGALDDISLNENSERTMELSMALMASDVALVFIDSIILYHCKNIIVARRHLGVNPIMTVLSKAKERLARAHKKMNVIFVLTKIDAIPENAIPALKERVKELYSNIYSQFGAAANEFKIFDVSAVGRNTVKTTAEWIEDEEEGSRHFYVTNDIITRDLDFEASNIVAVLARAFLEGINNVEYDVVQLESSIQNLKSTFNRWQKLIDTLFHKSVKKHQIFSLEGELRKSKSQLNDLASYRFELENLISKKY